MNRLFLKELEAGEGACSHRPDGPCAGCHIQRRRDVQEDYQSGGREEYGPSLSSRDRDRLGGAR